jgi:cytochrome P450
MRVGPLSPHSLGITPRAAVSKPPAQGCEVQDTLKLSGQVPLPPGAEQLTGAALSQGLIAPGALLSVGQVVEHLQSQGVEFRSTGWWPRFSSERAESLQKKGKLEYRVEQGKWARVSSPRQLAHMLAASELVRGTTPSAQAQGLSATAHQSGALSAMAAAGAGIGPALAGFTKRSAPFKLLTEPKRVGTLAFGSGLLRHMKNPVKFFDDFHAQHGKAFLVQLPTGQKFLFDHRNETVREALMVTDSSNTKVEQSWFKPELQGHGLSFLMGMDNVFLASGSEWKKTHGVIKPHLHSANIHTDEVTTGVGQMVERHIVAIKEKIRAQGGSAEIDFRQEMQKATLDVALQLLLGTELKAADLQKTQDAFQKTTEWLALETANPTDISLSRLPGNGPLREADDHLQGLAANILQEHRRQPKENSVVSSLLREVDPDTGQPFSDKRICNEILTLLLAGHETTATLLSWSFAELSRRPDLWKQLQSEVDTNLKGRFPGHKDLKELKTVEATVEETLRLYSPAYFLVREAAQDTTVGPPDELIHAPKGTQLIMSTLHMQRDPDDWGPKAADFDPARFLSGDHPRGKMFPFGTGARVCMGQHLAKLEANLILTRFAQEFSMQSRAGQPLEMESDISVHPSDAKVHLSLREDGPTSQGPPARKAVAACPFLNQLKDT